MSLRDYGLTPGPSTWKLFEIDGWTLLASVGPDEHGNGFGVRYTTNTEDGQEVSVWIGDSSDDGEDNPVVDALLQAWEEMDEDGARKALQLLMDQAFPIMKAH